MEEHVNDLGTGAVGRHWEEPGDGNPGRAVPPVAREKPTLRNGLGLRITASIAGLMIAAIAIAIGGLYWAADKTDKSAMRFERGLLRNSLDVEKERVAKEIETYVVGDIAYRFAHARFNSDWVHARIGQRLTASRDESLVVLLDPNHHPVYANANGSIDLTVIDAEDGDGELKATVLALVERVEQKYFEAVTRHGGNQAQFAPDYRQHIQAIYESAFELVDGQPAIVNAMAVVPDTGNIRLTGGAPSVLVTFRAMDTAALRRIGRLNRLSDVRFFASSNFDGMPINTLPLYDGSSGLIGYLTWTPSQHGSAMLDEASPMMVLALLVLLILAVGVLRHTHVSTVRLAYSESLARHRALHDSLSELPNRVLFSQRLSAALAKAAPDELVGVIYVDLDYFKEVNDTLGHHAGDELIKQVARRLQGCIQPGDTVSRISGDEFALLVVGRKQVGAVIDVCRGIEAAFDAPFEVRDQHLHSTCSMGLVIADATDQTPSELLRRADIALYRAKAEGRGRYIRFQPAMDDELRLSQQLERELRHALADDQFELLYQPQVSADGKTTLGVEALIRWRHPEKGLLTPDHFMAIVERTDLIWQVGNWVIRSACRAGQAWPNLSMAVNVSPAQIRHPDFSRMLHQILEEENFDPRRLELEVTESVVMDHLDSAARIFENLRKIGVRIALDDFGTGYSSLSYLRRFAFDKFKIDRSFITTVETEPEAAAIVHTLVALADALGMRVTAEGIETEGQHRFLQGSGCESLQGYLFSRPVSAAEISRRLNDEGQAGVPKAQIAVRTTSAA